MRRPTRRTSSTSPRNAPKQSPPSTSKPTATRHGDQPTTHHPAQPATASDTPNHRGADADHASTTQDTPAPTLIGAHSVPNKRSTTAARVLALYALGYTSREIGELTGYSPGYVRDVKRDPDGQLDKARKASYGGSCIDCGRRTDGSNGRAQASKRCDPCRRAFVAAKHGTSSKYQAGCRCDECRAASTVEHYKLSMRTPPSHGLSGYRNYRCRCDVCKAAGSADNRLQRQKREARVKA